jgi:hypothetical protein
MLLLLLQLNIITIEKPGFLLLGSECQGNGFQTIAAGEDPCRETLLEYFYQSSIIETGEALMLLELDNVVIDQLMTLLNLFNLELCHRSVV